MNDFKDNNNYIVIQKWMVSELGLKGSELIVYALVYGFSQIENHSFHGSLQYIADWCSITRVNALKNLQKLVDKGLIKKEDRYFNGIHYCEYSVITEVTSVSKTDTRVYLKQIQGVSKIDTNNINNNISNNIDIKKERKKESTSTTYQQIIDEFTINDEMKKTIWEFIKMRKLIKSPMTDNALRLMLIKLKKLANTESEQIEILNQSIERSWKGIFPLEKSKLKKGVDLSW